MIVDIKIPQIIFTIFNVLVLFWILRRFLFRPVTELLEQREQHVRQQLEEAEASRAEAKRLVAEYEERLAEAKDEARRLIEAATRQAEANSAQIDAVAREQAQQIIERAEREIGLARDKAIAALRDELGQLAILAAEHVLGRKLDAEADQKLVDEFLQELAQEGTVKAHVQ
ncbi:MAG: F0F1 ATP synthase subunit B [Bacillota bacterium]|jgi:F-type H+-transporting ATPase subunit b